jgi:hypothetical protein
MINRDIFLQHQIGGKQLYCKIRSQGIIVGLGFSKFELDMCEKFGFKAMIFDGKYLELL